MLNRVARAALLRASVYREMRDDPAETFIALAVVLASGVALGLGWQSRPDAGADSPTWLSVMLWIYARVGGWFIWAGIAYIVGTKLLGGQAGYRALARSLGLTFGPGVLAIIGGAPAIWPALLQIGWMPDAIQILLSAGFIWLFPAGWVAIRETQQCDWVRALICTILGWLVGIYLPSLLVNVLIVSSAAAP